MTLKSLRQGLLAWVGVLAVGMALSPIILGQTLGTAQAQSMPSIALTALTNQIASGTTPNITTLSLPASSGAVTVTFPTVTSTLATIGGTETLTAKTLTAPIIASISNTGTITLPTATGGVATQLYCGSTGTGNQTCSPTAAGATTKIYAGHSTLSSNAAVITFPTAFNSTTYDCVANDITTRANVVQMLSTSNSTATITNTTGASDVINWICVGQ